MEKNKNSRDEGIGKVPEDVVIEILVRGGIREWEQISCVKKQWASLFRCDCECFWQAALSFYYPHHLPLPPPPTKVKELIQVNQSQKSQQHIIKIKIKTKRTS